MFQLLPFDGISGNALAYNREAVEGGAGVIDAESDDIASDATDPLNSDATNSGDPAEFTAKTTSLTTIIGQAMVNGLIEVTRSDVNDQKAIQVASKAKHVGRIYQQMLINGSGAGAQFQGLIGLFAASQKVDTGTDGSALSFDILDQLLDLVTDKDGAVDYFAMHARSIRKYFALLRALGGASVNEVVELPGGDKVPAYRGVPIFRNDYIPINATSGAGGATKSYVLAGTFDDGSRSHGIAGLTAREEAGIRIVEVGEMENQDATLTRIKWYCGLAHFSEKGLAMAPNITAA
jgi:hypothetical protein